MISAIHSAKPLMNAKWMWSGEDGISLICQCHEENEEPELCNKERHKSISLPDSAKCFSPDLTYSLDEPCKR